MKRDAFPIAAIALALITGGAAAFGVSSWSTGSFGVAEALDSRSARILSEGATPEEMAEVRALSRTAASLSPYNNSVRLRRVALDAALTGRLSAESARAIEESYDLFPVDHTTADWRIPFCLEHWGEISPATRLAVRSEILALASLHHPRWDVVKVLQSVQDPRGRLAAMFILQELR